MRWNREGRGRSNHARALHLEEVAYLRAELLKAATVYGVCKVIAEGRRDVGEWIEWLRWVSGLLERIAEQTDGARDPTVLPAWLSDAWSRLEQSDGMDPQIFDRTVFLRWACDEFERIAELARPIERHGGEPLGEITDRPSLTGMRLLGLMQDSLVLVSAPDEASLSRAADAGEVLAHLRAARDEGVWELLER